MAEDDFSVPKELDRKTVDFLLETLHLHETGRISAETAVVRAQTVYGITAGLVPESTSALATQLATEVVAKVEQVSMHFWHVASGKAVRIRYPQGRGDFVVTEFTPGMPGGDPQVVHCEPGDERKGRIGKLIIYLTKNGYQPI